MQRLCHAYAITLRHTKVAVHVPHTTSAHISVQDIFDRDIKDITDEKITKKNVTQSSAKVPVTERDETEKNYFPYKNTKLDDDSWNWASHCYSKTCKDQEKLCSVLPVHPWVNLCSNRICSSVSDM